MTPNARPVADLNPRQQRFVEEYLVDLNAKQAAIRAGYSSRSAEVQGARLLGYAKVKRMIESGMVKRSKRTEVEADRVLCELARVAHSDIRDVFDPDGKPIPVHKWSDEIASAVKSIKVTTDRDGAQVCEIRLWDKGKALEQLIRHLGLDEPRQEPAVEAQGERRILPYSLDELARMIEERRALEANSRMGEE